MFELVMIIQFHNLRHFLLFGFTSCTSSNIVFSLNFSECVLNGKCFQFSGTTTGQISVFLLLFSHLGTLFRDKLSVLFIQISDASYVKVERHEIEQEMQKIRLRIYKSQKIGLWNPDIWVIHDCFMISFVEIWYESEQCWTVTNS